MGLEVEMNKNKRMVLSVVTLLALTASIAAQTPDDAQKARPRTTTSTADKDKTDQKTPVAGEKLEPVDTSRTPSDVPADSKATSQDEEEAAINSYYKNFFSTYKLGPEDVISVEVFNQDRYSRRGIVVPPSGRISLSLVPGGVFVNGKTVDEVAEIITKRYDEYIINPQVTVSLDKASSYRYRSPG